MVARTWRGWTRREDAEPYAAATTRDTEFVTLTFWESVEAIRSFAGDDVERAVFYAEDDRFLIEREETVTHWQVE